jgi:hypothetical protein
MYPSLESGGYSKNETLSLFNHGTMRTLMMLTETVNYHNETLITKSHFGYAIPQPQLLTADENRWLDCEG